MHSKLRLLAIPLALAAGVVVSQVALAQGKAPMSFARSDDDKDAYSPFNLSMPVVNLNKEMIVHMEANLGGHATLAIEGILKGAYEEVGEKDMEETGESRSSTAKGGTVLFSRYTNPLSMSGLYWGLGAGYREESLTWRVKPDENDPKVDYTLVDQDSRLNHDAVLTGTTGNLRVGYRYVGQEWPFVAGAYLGARHFQAGIRDGEPEEDGEDQVRLAPLTDQEKERLRRAYATRPECGVEIGFRF